MLIALVTAAAVVVSVEPARVNQAPQAAASRVVVQTTAGRAPKLWASAGELSAPAPIGGGRFEARWKPPASGPPAWAVIAAWDEQSGEAGAATVELWARTEIPVETEPNARLVVATGGHKVTARADASGRARVATWVGPTVRRAKVTAEDAAGNTTVEEVAIEVPPAPALWAVDGSAPNGPLRVYAFSVARVLPHLEASVGDLEVEAVPGLAVGTLRGATEASITASTDDDRVTVALTGARADGNFSSSSGGNGSGPTTPPAPRLAPPRWEAGVVFGPRISDVMTGAALMAEYRHRIRATRFHLGVDAGVAYASGVASSVDVQLGGVVARAVGEVRFSIGSRVALFLSIFIGGAIVGEHRKPSSGNAFLSVDGGPSFGAGGGLLTRLGPGLLTVEVGGAWTPLVGLGLANLDGGLISAGYRFARW